MDRISKLSDTGTTREGQSTSSFAPVNTGNAAALRVGAGATAAPTRSGDSVDGLDFSQVPAGESPPGSLAYQEVRFGPAGDKKFTDPNLKVATSQGTDEKTLEDNQPANFKWSVDVLQDKKGNPIYTPGLGDMQQEFKDHGDSNWNYQARLKPHGGVGDYASMKLEESASSDGVSPSRETQYRTVDKNTGEVIRLSQLLTPEDFQKVVAQVNDVQSYVPKAEDYLRGPEQLRQYIDESFALSPGKKGKTNLSVAIPSSNQSHDGNVAEYNFEMPNYFHPH